jgi:hypothetical protein
MSTIQPGRMTAAHSGPLVVFVIGMRINHFHKVGKWLPVFRAMPAMLEELYRNPESGFLGTEFMLRNLRTVVLLQYWRDFDALEAYARALLAAGKKIKAIETFDQLLQLNLPTTWKDRINQELDQMAEEF